MSAFEAGLASEKADLFDLALTLMGKLLGWNAYKPEGQGKPDSVWVQSDKLTLAFESKSDEKAVNAISIRTVRQALTHEIKVNEDDVLASDGKTITIVVSPRSKIDEDAVAMAADLRYMPIETLRELGSTVRAALRGIRSAAGPGADQVVVMEEIQKTYAAAGLLPNDVKTSLTSARLKSIPAQ